MVAASRSNHPPRNQSWKPAAGSWKLIRRAYASCIRDNARIFLAGGRRGYCGRHGRGAHRCHYGPQRRAGLRPARRSGKRPRSGRAQQVPRLPPHRRSRFPPGTDPDRHRKPAQPRGASGRPRRAGSGCPPGAPLRPSRDEGWRHDCRKAPQSGCVRHSADERRRAAQVVLEIEPARAHDRHQGSDAILRGQAHFAGDRRRRQLPGVAA